MPVSSALQSSQSVPVPVPLYLPDNCSVCRSSSDPDIHSCGILSNTAKVKNVDEQPHLCLESSISAPGSSADEMLRAWMEQADKLENGEISKKEYDEWRYKYPELDTYQKRAKVPSQELSDYLVKELTKKEK